MIRIKICCIGSPDEARLAIDAGASALGLVGNMPSGPGVIGDALIRQIASLTPPPIAYVCVDIRNESRRSRCPSRPRSDYCHTACRYLTGR